MHRVTLAIITALLAGTARPGYGQTGELRISAGVMTGMGADGSPVKPVTAASFSFVSRGFSFGPEVFYAFGDQRILGLGGVARIRIASGRFHPYLVAGLGGNFWRTESFGTAGLFTGSLGAGIELARNNNLGMTMEGRAHKNLQNYSGEGNWDFISVAAGIRLGW